MCLEPDEYMKMFNITKNLSTEKLHKLDRYWKDNVENTAEEQGAWRKNFRNETPGTN